MNGKNKDYISIYLPDEIGNMTVNNLMNHPDTEVVKRGNKLSIRHRSSKGIVTLEFISCATDKSISVTRKELKKEYKEDVISMKNQGMSQKDIAFELGISEAYVSRMLR